MSFANVITAAVLALLIVASYIDVIELRIPNTVPLFVTALFLAYVIAKPVPVIDAGWHLLAGISVLLVVFLLFSVGFRFGGGDAKLLSALSLWCGFAQLAPFLIAMSFVGGALGIIVFLIRRSAIPQWLAEHDVRIRAFTIDGSRAYVPFAPAMAASFVYVGLR